MPYRSPASATFSASVSSGSVMPQNPSSAARTFSTEIWFNGARRYPTAAFPSMSGRLRTSFGSAFNCSISSSMVMVLDSFRPRPSRSRLGHASRSCRLVLGHEPVELGLGPFDAG